MKACFLFFIVCVSQVVPMEADTALLAGARKMNGDALMEIFDLYTPALYNYAFRLCHNAVMADQIVGDVFAKLFEHLSAGSGPRSNLRSYLYEIAYHLFVDKVRHSHLTAPIEAVGFTHTDGYSTYVRAEDRLLFETILRAIMNDLTHDQRHVIILRFMEGFSVKETAAIIGKKVGNVRVIQTRAIAVLREALDYQAVETDVISRMIRSLSPT
jgi:RNA polymerase sigma-70 factor, ECF subfamily